MFQNAETTALDTFTRADNTDLGTAWTVPTGGGACQIVSNAVEAQAVNNTSTEIYTAIEFANNQWAQVAAASITDNLTQRGGVVLRGITANETYYSVRITSAADNAAQIVSFINGSATVLASVAASVATGDIIRGEIFGSGILGYKNSVLILTVANSDIASGKPGLTVLTQNITFYTLDNWFGGDFFSPIDFSKFPKPKIRDAVLAGWLA